MLRVVLLILVVLNLLFFGWARGWFGDAWPPPGHSQREPERVNAQVHPERFVALAASAARLAAAETPDLATNPATTPASSPASATAELAAGDAAAATVCLQAGPFSDAQVVTTSRALGRGGVDTNAVAVVPVDGTSWMVLAGRFADNNARRTRLLAWQRQKVPEPELLDSPEALAPGLVFSRHLSKAEADQALATLSRNYTAVAGVARVVQTPAGGPRLALLRAPAADAVQAKRLLEFELPAPGKFVRCVAR